MKLERGLVAASQQSLWDTGPHELQDVLTVKGQTHECILVEGGNWGRCTLHSFWEHWCSGTCGVVLFTFAGTITTKL